MKRLSLLFTLLCTLLVPRAARATPPLELELGRAALDGGLPALARTWLAEADGDDWRLAWTWLAATGAMGREDELRATLDRLATHGEGAPAAVARAMAAAREHEPPGDLTATGVDPDTARQVAARALIEAGRPEEALALLAGATSEIDRELGWLAATRARRTRELAQRLDPLLEAGAWGELGLLWRLPQPPRRLQRRILAQVKAAVAADDTPPATLVGAWRTALAAGRADLAQAALQALARRGLDLPLPTRIPWSESMIRQMARALATSRDPVLERGGSPYERQRVWLEVARLHVGRGQSDLAHQALLRATAPEMPREPEVLLAAAHLGAGFPERVGWLREGGRLALETGRLDLLDGARAMLEPAWPAEEAPPPLLEAWLAADGDPAALADLAAGLLEAGHRQGALAVAVRAAAKGAEGLEPLLERARVGLTPPAVLVALERERLARPPTPLPEPRRLEPRTLRGLAGPVTLEPPPDGWLVVAFWATWCPPCRAELPDLLDMAQRLRDEELPVRVVLVSFDSKRSDLERFVRRHRIQGVELAWAPELMIEWGGVTLPQTWIVATDGLVVDVVRGYRPDEPDRVEWALRSAMAADRR